jgi:hypothetical protein
MAWARVAALITLDGAPEISSGRSRLIFVS